MRTRSRLIKGMLHAALAVYTAMNIYFEHNASFTVSVPYKLLLAGGFIALLSLAFFWGAHQETPQQRTRRIRRYLLILFAYYIWILSNMLFFDAAFGRTRHVMSHSQFYAVSTNFKPFDTIMRYIHAYQNRNLSLEIIAVNLVGNVAAFAPMGFFLPVLYKRMHNFILFTMSIIAMVCVVETAQIVTMTGSCDIDDLILNTAGAVLMWLIIQLPPIKKRAYGLME